MFNTSDIVYFFVKKKCISVVHFCGEPLWLSSSPVRFSRQRQETVEISTADQVILSEWLKESVEPKQYND